MQILAYLQAVRLSGGRLLVNIMSYPYRILTGKIKANAQDLETWVRHCLDKYFVVVERVDLDETKRRFFLYFRQKILQVGEEPLLVLWGAAELIEWRDDITEIMGMWVYEPKEWEPKLLRRKNTDVIYEERSAWLQELGDKVVEKFGILEQTKKPVNEDRVAHSESVIAKEHTGEKKIDDYSVGDLLQFERGKTPKSWFIFVSCLAYLQDPKEPGAIGLMQRAFKALVETKEEINKLRQLFPNNPGVVDIAQTFEKSYPMLGDQVMPEGQIMTDVALALVESYKTVYKDPRAMLEDNGPFFNNSELIPDEKRTLLAQLRTMKIGDAGTLMAAKPLLEKWKNELIAKNVQPEPVTLLTPAQAGIEGPKVSKLPRVPKQPKRLNDWKAVWRKIKGRWKGGGNYRELAQLGNVSPETIADIVKAGDAGLLD